MFSLLRCWRSVTANKTFTFSNTVRFGYTQSNAKPRTPIKFTFSHGVKFLNKKYYDIERVVKIQAQPAASNSREPIFIFPGFEGRVSAMLPLIENIGRTAFCLQYPFEGSPPSTSETAETLLPHLENSIDSTERVNIVAHSFGGLVALDVIKLLESKGRHVRLCLSDTSPQALKIFGLHTFGDVYSAEFETNMVIVLLNSLCIENIAQFSDVVQSSSTFHEKIEILSPRLTKFCSLDETEIKIFCLGLFNLTKSMLIYDESFVKFKCHAALIRPDIRIWEFPDDYKISNHFEKPVKTFFTPGHHVSMLKNRNTADLVNQIFERYI